MNIFIPPRVSIIFSKKEKKGNTFWTTEFPIPFPTLCYNYPDFKVSKANHISNKILGTDWRSIQLIEYKKNQSQCLITAVQWQYTLPAFGFVNWWQHPKNSTCTHFSSNFVTDMINSNTIFEYSRRALMYQKLTMNTSQVENKRYSIPILAKVNLNFV